MKALAKRTSLIEPSSTLTVMALAKKLKNEGKDVIDFSAGEPDFDTPENIKTAAKKALDEGQTKYTPVPGTPELRDTILKKLKKENGLVYERDNIIVTNGAKQALFNTIMALVNDGDEVIVPAPYWVSYPEQVLVFGGKPVIITTNEASGFKITPEQLVKAITKKTKAIILNSPSNPTGAGYNKKELKALADICVENDLFIISDEIYEHIIYDDFEFVSVAALSEEIKRHTLVVNGVSKAFAMTGWRMGYAAGPKEIINAMSDIQGQSTSGISSITQAACVEALSGPQETIKKMVRAFAERRSFLIEALNAIPGISCHKPEGAFYAFPHIAKLFGKKTPDGVLIKNSQDFCVSLIKNHGVACVHGSAFGAEGFVRLSYATSLENLKTGIARLTQAITELS